MEGKKDIQNETIKWQEFTINSTKLYSAQIGIAVIGNVRQILIANDIHRIMATVILNDDNSIHWQNPPDKFQKEVEETMKRMYP